ncbi:hypothetical protein AN476_08525 [Phaeobacter sp. 11ANDIMAR09]|nr:hypothetical protein AN476_08525 [Phaeobacter sp. 11ANDIMAR09]
MQNRVIWGPQDFATTTTNTDWFNGPSDPNQGLIFVFVDADAGSCGCQNSAHNWKGRSLAFSPPQTPGPPDVLPPQAEPSDFRSA